MDPSERFPGYRPPLTPRQRQAEEAQAQTESRAQVNAAVFESLDILANELDHLQADAQEKAVPVELAHTSRLLLVKRQEVVAGWILGHYTYEGDDRNPPVHATVVMTEDGRLLSTQRQARNGIFVYTTSRLGAKRSEPVPCFAAKARRHRDVTKGLPHDTSVFHVLTDPDEIRNTIDSLLPED